METEHSKNAAGSDVDPQLPLETAPFPHLGETVRRLEDQVTALQGELLLVSAQLTDALARIQALETPLSRSTAKQIRERLRPPRSLDDEESARNTK